MTCWRSTAGHGSSASGRNSGGSRSSSDSSHGGMHTCSRLGFGAGRALVYGLLSGGSRPSSCNQGKERAALHWA